MATCGYPKLNALQVYILSLPLMSASILIQKLLFEKLPKSPDRSKQSQHQHGIKCFSRARPNWSALATDQIPNTHLLQLLRCRRTLLGHKS